MTIVTSTETIGGKIRKVQTLTYNDGMISKRIFKRVTDIVPFDIIWVKKAQAVPRQLVFCCE